MILRLGDRRPVLEGTGHFIADSASVIGNVRLAARVSIWYGAVLRGDNDWIEIGEESNVQDGAILHTDPGLKLTIGDNVTIGHRALLHGCRIGSGSLVGIGSTVLNGAVIGASCLVGAHTLVTEAKTFPDGVLILGTPARVVRGLNHDEYEMLKRSAQIYVEHAARYNAELEACAARQE
ncbi:MAG: gamma carbonic anhydrase family protein [Woeseiaceae bacterium]